ncbi:LSU ribosomal protein L35AE [Giardia duodenalis assemblage B]|uniref:LSU ribosomal protein L35AE n=3 Tax=Giardia intestinalis TaxID=5741 RepID=A0A132NZZ2_GIAIN|nr:Ribosomal protein L35a [Giardia intestinalis ATCC 50581]ESU41069.1 LSU ribosomal protein L35AE [Giardia intestinalis]KWX15649.1 LSU ribosomal protein L35AE [Giardia intestinalis assemblage B]
MEEIKGKTFLPAIFVGYQRSKVKQRENVALVKVSGIYTRAETDKVIGRLIAIIHSRSGKPIFGKICRPHGNSGMVRARFYTNLPGQLMGHKVRVFYDNIDVGDRATPKYERLYGNPNATVTYE